MYFKKIILPLAVLCILKNTRARNIELPEQTELSQADDNEEVANENSRTAKQFGFGFGLGDFNGNYGGGHHHHHGGQGSYGGHGGYGHGGYGHGEYDHGGYGHGGYGHGGYGHEGYGHGGYGHGGYDHGGYDHGGYGNGYGYGGYGDYDNDFRHGHHHHHGFGRGLQTRFGNEIRQYYPPGPSYSFAPPSGVPIIPFPVNFKRPVLNGERIPVAFISSRQEQKYPESIQTRPSENTDKQNPPEKVEQIMPIKENIEKVPAENYVEKEEKLAALEEKPVAKEEKKNCIYQEEKEDKNSPIKKV